MWNTVRIAFIKELLLVWRDKGGVAALFIMPTLLIVIMAIVMDAPFRNYQESQIELVLVDNDKDSLGVKIRNGLEESGVFKIIEEVNNAPVSKEDALQLVKEGDYLIALIIPKGITYQLNAQIEGKVNETLSALGAVEADTNQQLDSVIRIQLVLDPAVKKSFKNTIQTSLTSFVNQMQSDLLITAFQKALYGDEEPPETKNKMTQDFVGFEHIYPGGKENFEANETNSVQHNVPAWAIFAMFFIIIPLAGNMIKENDEGMAVRLKLAPVSYFWLLVGKLKLYVLVCLLQMLLMLVLGVYLMPVLGLSQLQIGTNPLAILLVTLCTAIAASSLGIFVGTVFKTQQQATTFSSIAIVIFAALGGIWVPLFAMPESMQLIGSLSPLNWALEAYNDLFLRNGNLASISTELVLLFGFSVVVMGSAFVLQKKTN